MKMPCILALLSGALLAGCGRPSYLEQRTTPERPDFGDTALPAQPTPSPALPPRSERTLPPPAAPAPPAPDLVTGTWTFKVPTTVTRVERRTSDFSQFSLYMGRPAPTDTPFLVITISADPSSIAESDPEAYQISGRREYAVNGNPAHELTGNKNTGEGFCELLIRKPTNTGDICHAMAVAKTEEERQLSLEILGSITWTSSGVIPASKYVDPVALLLMQALAESPKVERELFSYRWVRLLDGVARDYLYQVGDDGEFHRVDSNTI